MPGPSKVQWVHKAQGSGSSSTTRRQVTGKIPPELCVLVYATQKDLLVLVLEREVQSLSREVPNHVSHVSSPVSSKSLFLWDTYETVHHTYPQTSLFKYKFSNKLNEHIIFTYTYTYPTYSFS